MTHPLCFPYSARWFPRISLLILLPICQYIIVSSALATDATRTFVELIINCKSSISCDMPIESIDSFSRKVEESLCLSYLSSFSCYFLYVQCSSFLLLLKTSGLHRLNISCQSTLSFLRRSTTSTSSNFEIFIRLPKSG